MTPLFQTGNAVRVRKGSPPGHIRTPFYVRGCKGVIERVAGEYRNPEELAFGRFDTPLYPFIGYVSNNRKYGRITRVIHKTLLMSRFSNSG